MSYVKCEACGLVAITAARSASSQRARAGAASHGPGTITSIATHPRYRPMWADASGRMLPEGPPAAA
jgi:ribosomal protein S18 acetylase RimI-like enzyme